MLTVTTPASTTDLTTLAAVKAELGISTTEHDTQLGNYISQASDSVISYCNRVFARESVSETFRIERPGKGLVLSRYPVTAIASVVENGVTLAASDYETNAGDGVLWRLQGDSQSRWACGKIVVNYTGGYLLPNDVGRNLPNDIERAAIMMVVHAFNVAGTDASVKRESIDGIGSTERFQLPESGIAPDVESLLARYRQVAL